MSALQIGERLAKDHTQCATELCGRKGRRGVLMAGWVVPGEFGDPMRLCDTCAKDWERMWADALTGTPR